MIINSESDSTYVLVSVTFVWILAIQIQKNVFLHSNYDMRKDDFKNLQFPVGDKLGIKCIGFIQ